jgi:hypothetical protein
MNQLMKEVTVRRLTAITASALFAMQLAAHAAPSAAEQPRTFSTAQEASQALYFAVQGKDEKALTAILGARKELLSSNNTLEDRRERLRFIEKYKQMHRLVREPDASTVLYIGAENWPFPIPLVSDNGGWHFDAEAGMAEVLYRRIGEDEVNALQACHALALARREHQWMERDPSMRPLHPLFGDAARGAPSAAFHGYRFRSLGSGFVAHPEVYGSTGVMTFVVDQEDVVYAKDLGPNTAAVAKGMSRYAPDPTWHRDE